MNIKTFTCLLPLLGLLSLFLTGCSKNGAVATPANPNVDYYTCTMHPSVHLHNPNDKCPICGMDLVPVMKRNVVGTTNEPQAVPIPQTNTANQPMSATPMPETPSVKPSAPENPEIKTFEISPQRLQALGVTTEIVGKRQLTRDLRAPAFAEMDESTLYDVNIKTAGGYIQKLYANYDGKPVKKGEPLMTVLSEGWIDAQIQYIKAYRSLRRIGNMNPNQNVFELENKVNELRRRIRVWDLTDAQIKQLEKFALEISEIDLRTGKGLKGTFDLLSPINGHVYEKKAIEGMKFDAGQSLMRLADLSTIWIEAEFPENQSDAVTVGQTMEITFPALPDQTFKAKVEFLSPHLMEETRRSKVRFSLPNPGHRLMPGMYGNVTAKIPVGERLAVSTSAVIPTGNKYVVFLDLGGGKLEPRLIEVGQTIGDYYEVISGLSAGDKVVSSANFLIDAESRIQGALKTWGETK